MLMPLAPGPWRALGRTHVITTIDGVDVALAHGAPAGDAEDIQLMAAAWELREVLQDLVYSADSVSLSEEDARVLRPSADAARDILRRLPGGA